MSLDTSRPVQTRDGRKARILCDDLKGEFALAARVAHANGDEAVYTYTAAGHIYISAHESNLDLINIPERITREYFINLYEHGAELHFSKKEADVQDCDRLACVRIVIDYEKGEGLNGA